MCKTRHIQRTISKQRVSEYVNSVFLREGTSGLKQFREQILRLNERCHEHRQRPGDYCVCIGQL